MPYMRGDEGGDMSDQPRGDDWWRASDDLWYPPTEEPGPTAGEKSSVDSPFLEFPSWLMVLTIAGVVVALLSWLVRRL
jgi:hypothetical protein